jgi:hypothetical protein
MTKARLGWASTTALAILAGCGSAATNFGEGGSDDGETEGSSHKHDGSSSGDSPGGDSGSHDGTVNDTSNVSDGLLDINAPDGFTVPDGGVDSTLADSGVDAGCGPDSITCSGSTALTCKSGKVTKTTCSGSTSTCAEGYGCVVCDPGSGSCSGSTGTLCLSDGSGYVTNNCDALEGLTCIGGVCTGDCADIGQSYIGCEYYAVTMANTLLSQATFVFSVSIANTGSTSANINIQGGALGVPMTGTIAPGAVQGFVLPWVPALSMATATVLAKGGAYHIRSTEPVTVYEFNARDYCVNSLGKDCATTASGSTYSYTNDASLLLPVNAMTGNYVSAGYNDWVYPAYITVVATQGSTSVKLAANTTVVTGGVPGLTTTGGTVSMNAGDVLQLMTPGTGCVFTPCAYGGDLSGSIITATAPVEVFGGTDCIYIPSNQQACDHTEQINFPVETLGKDYLVTVPYNDNDASPNLSKPDPGHGRQYVKIVGTVAGTALTYDGIAGKPAVVGAGGVVTFEAYDNFHVTSSQPIEVAQYMEGQENFGPACNVTSPAGQSCGDPAETLTVPTTQFRSSYPFTSPANYFENWVNVIAPTGATVTVTDTPSNHTITTGSVIGTSGYYVAHVQLCADNLAGCTGNHSATSTSAFGIQVYGYGSATSYSYPGGLNLTR